MQRKPLILAVGIFLLLVVFPWLLAFQVRTNEVAVVTTFGRPTRSIDKPGLKFKAPPPIQSVHKFDRRVHNFESKFEQVLTSDGYSLLIMVYAGWNIENPELFFPRFSGSTARAEESLQGLVRNAYSGVVGKHPFSHFISTDEKELKLVQIEQEMLERIQSDVQTNHYGVEVKFLGIKKVGLPESVTQLVFERMRSERALQEGEILHEGTRQAEEIRSRANLDSSTILSAADAQATTIRGQGARQAAESFRVFEQEPDFANFLQNVEGLESFMKERTTLLLDENTSPINMIKGLSRPAPSTPARTQAEPEKKASETAQAAKPPRNKTDE